MTKAVFRLVDNFVRARAVNALRAAPDGVIVTIAEPKRSTDANAALWATLTEISVQAVHPVTGAQLSPEVWKLIVMDALGCETTSVESLDGAHRVPVGLSSSRLSKREFSDLLEFTHKLATELGVMLHDNRRVA